MAGRLEPPGGEPRRAARSRLHAIVDRVGEDAWTPADHLDVAIGMRASLERDRLFTLLAAHLPGLAPTLRLIYDHVMRVPPGDEVDCCSEIAHLPD